MEPLSCETPRILCTADILREKVAFDVILAAAENPAVNTDDLLVPLLEEFPSSDVWYAAMTCPYHDVPISQDIPLVEAAMRNQFSLISSFITLIPMSESRKKFILDAPGRYGRTAVKHAVSKKQWHAASMLIRHGCSLGLSGDQYGIVRNITNAVGVEPQTPNILAKVDVKDHQLSMLIMTIDSLYGYDWATLSAPLTHEVGLRPLKGISEECSYFSSSSGKEPKSPRTVGCKSWTLGQAHREMNQSSSSSQNLGSSQNLSSTDRSSFAHSSLDRSSFGRSSFSTFRSSSYCAERRSTDIGSWPTSAQSHGGLTPQTPHSPKTPLSPRAVSTPGGHHDYERSKNTAALMAKWTIRESYTPESKHTPVSTPSPSRLHSERG